METLSVATIPVAITIRNFFISATYETPNGRHWFTNFGFRNHDHFPTKSEMHEYIKERLAPAASDICILCVSEMSLQDFNSFFSDN